MVDFSRAEVAASWATDVTAQRIRRMWRVLVDNADRDPYASLVRDGHAEFWHVVEVHVRDQAGAWRSSASV
jgi:hypothetical protein